MNWEQCESCNQIFEAGIGKCPNCGQTYDKAFDFIEWPDLTIKIYFSLLQSLLAEQNTEKRKVSLVIFCTISDLLFEDILVLVLKNLSTDKRVKDFIIQNNWTDSKRRELFYILTGIKMNSFLKQNGYSNFLKDYKDIRQMRNRFVHHELHSVSEDDIKKVRTVSEDMFKVFMLINNEFCIKKGK